FTTKALFGSRIFTAKENGYDTPNQERRPGAWSFRRWLRLGTCRKHPQEGWVQGVGGAAARDLLRRRRQIHEGGHRCHGRASGSGGSQLWRGHYHPNPETFARRGAFVYLRTLARA